jgi:SulP family sulfate permease
MMMHRPQWLHHVSWLAVVSGLTVAFSIVGLAKYKRVPAAAISVAVGSPLCRSMFTGMCSESVTSVKSFRCFPNCRFRLWMMIAGWIWLIATLPLGLLASLESLLSAQALDRMVKDRRPHEPNLELIWPRTCQHGGRSVWWSSGDWCGGAIGRERPKWRHQSLSSLLHGLASGWLVLTLAPIISSIPQAALAGLLCVVGFRLIEWRTLFELAKKGKSSKRWRSLQRRLGQ